MILHIVLFKWKEGVKKEQVDAIYAAMAKLPAAIHKIKRLVWGSYVIFREGNADWALAAIFANQADWQAYQVHPDHQAIVKDLVTPILESRTAIQMPVPAAWQV